MTEQTKYPANALEHFRDGALLDLRVRMAFELLTHSPILSWPPPRTLQVGDLTEEEIQKVLNMTARMSVGPLPERSVSSPAEDVARFALDIASALLAEAESRGLIDPLPTDGELDPLLRSQAKRTASYQTLQQMEAQKFAQAEQDRVIPQAPSRLVPGGRMN